MATKNTTKSTTRSGGKSSSVQKTTSTKQGRSSSSSAKKTGTKQTNKTRSKNAPKTKAAEVKSSPKEELVPELSNELVLLITLVVSVLLFLSNFSLSGKVGEVINRATFGLFGVIGETAKISDLTLENVSLNAKFTTAKFADVYFLFASTDDTYSR